ncbi:hypothetical protein KKC06_00350 [Patescibacteria group bacterium]|nr:hypothetical protein [Patescibacteria group bacterium]
MISFNLLGHEEKNSLRKLKVYYIIKHISFLAISLVLIISITLYFNYLLLNNENESLDENIEGEISLLEQEKITSIEDTIEELNQQLVLIEGIQAEYIEWSGFIDKSSSIIPDGIVLSSIKFDAINKKFTISGKALTRENLLELNENFENFVFFTKIVSPISNLIKKENIDFQILGEFTEKFYDQT